MDECCGPRVKAAEALRTGRAKAALANENDHVFRLFETAM